MFERLFAIALAAAAVGVFGGVVLAGAQSVSNRPAPAFVPAAVSGSAGIGDDAPGDDRGFDAPTSTSASVPTSQPQATVVSTATSVPTSQPRATTVTSVQSSVPTSPSRSTTVSSAPSSVPGVTVTSIDDHGGDRPRSGNSGPGSSGSGSSGGGGGDD